MKVQFRNLRLKDLGKSRPSGEKRNRASGAAEGARKIVFFAGPPSHGYAEHEYYAGCRLLADRLHAAMPAVATVVARETWPTQQLDDADAIVLMTDGDRFHPVLGHLEQVDRLMHRGVGLACIHWSVNLVKGRAGDLMRDWIGGYYEPFWSVNPFWTADFRQLPDHPITRGVAPFSIRDEWYYHHAVSGQHGGRHADPFDRPRAPASGLWQRQRQPGGPRSAPAWPRSSPGAASVRTAAAASASPAGTFTGTGPTTISARSC